MSWNTVQQRLIINDIVLTAPPQSIMISGVDTATISPSLASYQQITPTSHGKTICQINLIFPFNSNEIGNYENSEVNDFHLLMSELSIMPFIFVGNKFIIETLGVKKQWDFAMFGVDQVQLSISEMKISLTITCTILDPSFVFPLQVATFKIKNMKKAEKMSKAIGIPINKTLPWFCDYSVYHGKAMFGEIDEKSFTKDKAYISIPTPVKTSSTTKEKIDTDKTTLDITRKIHNKEYENNRTENDKLIRINGKVRIIDGDTIHVTQNGTLTKIRLANIDAPEHDQKYGKESKQFLSRIIKDNPYLYANLDSVKEDIYGRYITDLYVSKSDIATPGKEIMPLSVSQIMALSGRAYANGKNAPETILKAEKTAKKLKKGIWSDPNAIKPWIYRKLKFNNIQLYNKDRVVKSYVIIIQHQNIYHHVPGSALSKMTNIGAPAISLYINMISNEIEDTKTDASKGIFSSWIKYRDLMLERGVVSQDERIIVNDRPINVLNLRHFYIMDCAIDTSKNPGTRLIQLKLLHDENKNKDAFTYEDGPFQYSLNFDSPSIKDKILNDLTKATLRMMELAKDPSKKELVNEYAKTASDKMAKIIIGLGGPAAGFKYTKYDKANPEKYLETFMYNMEQVAIVYDDNMFVHTIGKLSNELNDIRKKYNEYTYEKDYTTPISDSKPLLPHIMNGNKDLDVDDIIDTELINKMSELVLETHSNVPDYIASGAGLKKWESTTALYEVPLKTQMIHDRDTVLGKEQMIKADYTKETIGKGVISAHTRSHQIKLSNDSTKTEKEYHNKAKSDVVAPPKQLSHNYSESMINRAVTDAYKLGGEKQFTNAFANMFPTYKFYFIKDNTFGEEINAWSKLDSYFTTQRIMGMSLRKDKTSPMDILTLFIFDPILSSLYVQDHPKTDAGERPTENIKGPIPISPGAKVMLLLGHGNKSKNQNLVFNGTVTSVGNGTDSSSLTSTSGLTIVCSGYGSELLQYPNKKEIGDDMISSFDNIFQFISKMLSEPQLKHFGMWDEDNIASEHGVMREWSYTGRPADDNVFSPRISGFLKDEGLFFDNDNIDEYYYVGQNFFEILHEITYKFPGLISSAVPYGDRMTQYIGPRFGYYFSRPPSDGEARYAQEVVGSKIGMFTKVSGEIDLQKIAGKDNYLAMEPFAKTYYAISGFNLIANNLVSSMENVYNKVTIKYGGELKKDNDVAQVVFKDKNKISVKADDNIEDDFIKEIEIPAINCFGKDYAKKYASAYLAENMNTMYKGKIIISFAPTIKPYDLLAIHDNVNDMYGVVDVRACTHIFDTELGAITVITPGMITIPNDAFYSGITGKILEIAVLFGYLTTKDDISKFAIPGYLLYALYNQSRLPIFLHPIIFKGVPLLHGLGFIGKVPPALSWFNKIFKDYNDAKAFYDKLFINGVTTGSTIAQKSGRRLLNLTAEWLRKAVLVGWN